VITVIVIIVLIDTTIIRLSAYTGSLSNLRFNIGVFSFLVCIYSLTQYLLLRFISTKNREKNLTKLGLLRRIVSAAQYVTITAFILLILQMVNTSSYSVVLIKIVIWINYLMLIGFMGILCQRFIAWFRVNHNTTVLAYAIAVGMICISAASTVVNVNNSLTGQRGGMETVGPLKSGVSTVVGADNIYNYAYFLSSILSFIFTWVATTILLRQYSRKVSKIKFWIIVSLPLLYFLSQFQLIFVDIFSSIRPYEPVLFGIIFTLTFSATKPAGGILFGLAFWNIARKIRDALVKNYLMVSGCGLLLLFVCNQPLGISLAPYPPFGLVTISYLGLAGYLVMMGVYASAISVANDDELRKAIRRSVEQQSNLLDKIGMAQMHDQIQAKVMTITRNLSSQLKENSNIEASLEEDDEMKEYVEKVLEEIASTKKQD
jgi:hypothetical protein